MKDKAVILAVDDTAESLALLAGILTPAGYHVLTADSGELALAAAAVNPPDLILLDVRMKGLDGLEVCRRLKAAEATKHLPIILISAFAEVKEWVKGLQMGAADYISKPFQPEELLMRVRTHLALSRANVKLEKQKAALHQTDEQLQSEIVKRQRVEDKLRQNLDQATRSRQALLSAIEDHKQAANSLRETRDYLNSLIGYANAPIITWDTDHRITKFNHAFEILAGHPAAAVLGQNLNVLFPPESSAESLKKIANTSAGEFWDAVEIPIKRKNNEVRIVLWNSANIHAKDGKTIVATIAQGQDITERVKAEAAMRNSEARLRAILDATPFPIAIVDLQDNNIVYWSSSALVLFGHTAPTTAEWYALAYPDPDYRNKVIERWKPFLEKARSSGQPVNTGEYRVTCRDGSVRICELHATFLAENLIVTFNNISERKQAEENLKESHMLLRIAGKTAKIGGWSVNLEKNRAYWSDEVAAIHEMPPGYSPLVEEGISFYAPEWRERITKVFSDCSQKGIPYNEEMEITTAHGKRVWIQTIGEAVRNDEGVIYKVQGAFQDISERKQAEAQKEIAHEALKREQFLNNVIINSFPGAFYVLDENGRYTRWNAYQRDEIIGQPEDQVAGANAADTIHPDDRELIKARIANVLGRGREETVEGRVLLRGGPAYRWLLMTGRQIMIEGRPFLVGIGIDISERKRAESQREAALESLRESERKFRETVINLDEGYYSVTLDGLLLEHNQAFNRILGFDIHEGLKGVHLPDFWQNPEQRKEYLKAFAASGSISNYQIEAKTQKGDKITILASAHLVKDKDNQPQRIEGVFLDISQRMRAEAEIRQLNEKLEQRVAQRTALLEAANMELEAFSYSVSHDLRAPLRAIDGFSRIILEEYAPKLDAEGRRLLGVITGNTAKMGRLIDDLLAFSRLNRQQMAPAPVSLAVMANVVYSELKSLEKGRRIEFTIGALPAAHGDYSMLYLVLQNLLANAIKFTRKRSRAKIELAGQAGKDENIYQVKDNGVGFDMEYAHKIFDVFQRLHGSDEFEGTGVGLAIVQRIVLRHGGRVWAESSKKGATFFFSLPNDKGTGHRFQGSGKKEKAPEERKKK